MGLAEPRRYPSSEPVARKRGLHAIVRADVRPGSADLFEALLRDFADAVDADEAGCSSYVITRTFGSRQQFAVHARFVNWAAFRLHGETDHAKRMLPRLTALLSTPISMELFMEM